MFSFRACAAVLRSGILEFRSSIHPKADAAVISASCSPFRNFSSVFAYNATPKSASSKPLTSTLSALTINNDCKLLDGYSSLLISPSRSIMKNFWPRPRENKRIKKFGWKARTATPSGRRIIMRRILRGRHILTH